MSCFAKTANKWLLKSIMIQGYKPQVVFELTVAYAPEKGTISQNDVGQILFSSVYNPHVTDGYVFSQILRFFSTEIPDSIPSQMHVACLYTAQNTFS